MVKCIPCTSFVHSLHKKDKTIEKLLKNNEEIPKIRLTSKICKIQGGNLWGE